MMDGQRELAQAFVRAHPAETAAVLEGLPPSAAAELIGALPVALGTPVVEQLESAAAAAILGALAAADAAELLAALPPVSAASIARRAAPAARDAWLERLERRAADRIRALLSHSDRSAAALADPHALALPGDVTVEDAVARIRRRPAAGPSDVHVVDRARRLEGAVTLHQLLVADPESRLGGLIAAAADAVLADADVTAVIAHPAWRERRSLAVVDAGGVFLGAIDHERVRRLEREAAAGAGAQPVLAALLTLGEAYWIGLAGLLGGFVSTVGGGPPTGAPGPPR